MTKQTAIERKEQYLKQIAIYQGYIAELDAIINAPEPDPMVGKYFVFWDTFERDFCIREFKDASNNMFTDMAGARWSHCRPVTMADLEGKIYQEPKKTILETDKTISFSGVAIKLEEAIEDEDWNKAKSCVGDIWDLRDSLEERPEGV